MLSEFQQNLEEKVNFLIEVVPGAKNVSRYLMEKVGFVVTKLQLTQGTKVLEMGKVSTRLFWIKSGECLKREYNHEDPFNAFKFHDIVKMGPGTCFGEEGVIHSLEMP